MNTAILTPLKCWILLWLSTTIVSLSSASPPELHSKIFKIRSGKSYTEIPFQLIDNLIVVTVKVNDQRELNFLMDTGTASPVILHRRYIKGLNLPLGREINFQGAGRGKAVKATVINQMSLQIAGAYAAQLGAVVLQQNVLSHIKLKGVTIHGVLGASLFRSFAVEIDYPARILRLYDNYSYDNDKIYDAYPLKIVMSRPILETEVEWDDGIHKLRLMLDTGFNDKLLIYAQASFSNLGPKFETLGYGYSGKIMGTVSSVPSLRFGNQMLTEIPTFFPSYQAYKADETTTSYRDGIIGNALLKNYCIVLDYAQRRLLIRKPLRESPMMVVDKGLSKGLSILADEL